MNFKTKKMKRISNEHRGALLKSYINKLNAKRRKTGLATFVLQTTQKQINQGLTINDLVGAEQILRLKNCEWKNWGHFF